MPTSTADTSCCIPRRSSASRATRPPGRPRRWKGLPATASSRRSATTASGIPSTRCGTNARWNGCGRQEILRGKYGPSRDSAARALTDVLVVTSDKVYRNRGHGGPCDEGAALGGADPYSASKAACEHVASSFAATYFAASGVRLATARGGNVIGGGDRSEDRI